MKKHASKRARAGGATVQLVCAWCGTSLQPRIKPGFKNIVSHGICPACSEHFFQYHPGAK